MHFPTADISVFPLVPPLVAFGISVVTSPAGVSGAFLLLPFQVSVLGFIGPGVSATNLVFNVVAIPGGVYRYFREGRMAWPLAWLFLAGSVPGVLVGAYIRVTWLGDPSRFQIFMCAVLLYLGLQLLWDSTPWAQKGREKLKALARKFNATMEDQKTEHRKAVSAGLAPEAVVSTRRFNFRRCEFEFWRERFEFSTPAFLVLTLTVGAVGGIYGIGGGAIVAPICAAFFHLPLHAVAGAALLGTFVTSIVGVAAFAWLMPLVAGASVAVHPDWGLGLLFGLGGLAGIYTGARLQKYLPERTIRLILGLLITAFALRQLIVCAG